ncbi:MAG TPA: DUF1223 domain-containing protein [Gemmataceae bacterium]|nr:DUF1223 domain-containing protein [Gemmataceae bacterium]
MRAWALAAGLVAAAAVLGAILVRLAMGSNMGQAREADPPKDAGDAGTGVAVVELFTSEGCSSCPPADALLAEWVQAAREHGRPVYCLAFQVDYWNRLGWTDPYSDAAFSRRQNDYAQSLRLDQVYTPQMIVNGTDEFVGSDRERSRKSIEAALKRPAKAPLKLSVEKADAGAVVLYCEASSAPKGAVVNVAVVERGLVSKVPRGENGGRTLRHENVVRVFRTVSLDESGKGSVELKPPADVVQKNASAIAYIQESVAGAVLGANAVDLAPAESK